MTARIIDGQAAAQRVRQDCHERVAALERRGLTPGLAMVLVGDNPASRIYVHKKVQACEETALHSEVHELPQSVTQAELVARIDDLGRNPAIHGILVQLPLPEHIDTRAVVGAIPVDKDVDGFHVQNVGRLVVGEEAFKPCTPYGVMRLLEQEDIPVWGRHAVVVGASNLVGKPMALLLLHAGATITVCNSKTPNLAAHTIAADILVVAVGRPDMVLGPMVKRGAAVIDVGMNRLADGGLMGDVDFAGARERAGWITPVPGGVGPMTVAMLVVNTIEAAERHLAGTTD